jgi:uncharacterized LabA/DUF88 family protein
MLDLNLSRDTVVFVDWANVYGWRNVLREEFQLNFFLQFRKNYPSIKEIRFYFGMDLTKQSQQLITTAQRIGFCVVTKPVKYINIGSKRKPVYKRKCDMDLEIGLDAISCINQYEIFLFFSGDGDFKTLYDRLLVQRKRVIVIAPAKRTGREIFELKNKIGIILVKKSPQELLQERG